MPLAVYFDMDFSKPNFHARRKAALLFKFFKSIAALCLTPLLTHVPDKYESKEGDGLPCVSPRRGSWCNPVFSTLGVA